MNIIAACALFAVVATSPLAPAQSDHAPRQATPSVRARLMGAWRLIHIDVPGPDGRPAPLEQPSGMLIYTPDGHMSVQLMYPPTPDAKSNEYVRDGYEASFGSYDIDDAAHTITHHVQGSITRDLLVGKDLPRTFNFDSDGHLVLRSARADEHWSVTWEHF